MMYDGDGNRVAKSVTSGGVTTTTYYLVDDLNPTGLPQVMDELTNGVVTRTYTYGLQRISEDQIVNNAWTPSFYSYDGMGSVRQLTNTAGTVTDSYEYDAFGNQIAHTGTTPNNMLYRGEEWDPDLGLYYLRARYYNPLTGRFISRDPEDGDMNDPTTLHKYLYAKGDPVDGLDPTGRNTIALPLPQPQPSFRSAVEYVGIVGTISLGAVVGEKVLACAVNIQLSVDALRTEGDTNIVPVLPSCSAKGQKYCSEQEIETCNKLYEYCSGGRCGGCLSYCTTQCEWPFHKPECNKFKFPKDWKDFPPPPKWIN